jgi:hypothetical protein
VEAEAEAEAEAEVEAEEMVAVAMARGVGGVRVGSARWIARVGRRRRASPRRPSSVRQSVEKRDSPRRGPLTYPWS